MNQKPLHEMLAAYREFVLTGAMLPDNTLRERLLLAATGLSGEAGEVTDLIKKECFHGRTTDRQEYVLELGDVFWYVILALDAKGITIDEMIHENMVKLVNRYPDKHPNLHHLLHGA